MARKRYQPEQIVAILREGETTGSIKDVCRKHNLTETTFYRWKRMYGGVNTSEVQKMKNLEKENRQLKQLAGDPLPLTEIDPVVFIERGPPKGSSVNPLTF